MVLFAGFEQKKLCWQLCVFNFLCVCFCVVSNLKSVFNSGLAAVCRVYAVDYKQFSAGAPDLLLVRVTRTDEEVGFDCLSDDLVRQNHEDGHQFILQYLLNELLSNFRLC